MTQTTCPNCGQRATLLPDGAVYCLSEHRVVSGAQAAEGALLGDDPRSLDAVSEGHWRSTGRAIASGFGFVNLLLLALVIVALGLAVAGALVVLVS